MHRGFFDASLKPVLTIDSGDIVRLETATGNPRWFEKLGVPKDKIPAELYEVFQGVEGDGRGDHTLNGPIAIRGAEPGDMLEIRIRSVDVRLPIAGQSFVPNRGLLPDEFPYEKNRVTWIDVDRKVILFAPGIEFPAKPFWGVMGVAPPAAHGTSAQRTTQRVWRESRQPGSRFGEHAVSTRPRCWCAALNRRWARHAGPRRSEPVGG